MILYFHYFKQNIRMAELSTLYSHKIRNLQYYVIKNHTRVFIGKAY